MGAIKDLYDLGKNLGNKISDRKTMELIMPVLDKIKEAERENFDLKKDLFDLERRHHSGMTELQSKMSRLESKINHFTEHGVRLD